MHHASANAERRFSVPNKIKWVTSAAVRHGWMAGRHAEARIDPKRWDDAFIFFFFQIVIQRPPEWQRRTRCQPPVGQCGVLKLTF
jgi:hypothetical protein